MPKHLQAVEERVVDALPEIIDALIGRAKAGDLKAARLPRRPHPGTDGRGEGRTGRRPGSPLLRSRLRARPARAGRGRRHPADVRRKRGTQRSVVQWGSSIATADPTSTDPSGGAVGSLRNTWRAGSTPCSSPPSKTIERDERDERLRRATERAAGSRRPGASPRRDGRASPGPRPRSPERGGVSSAPSGRVEEAPCLKTSRRRSRPSRMMDNWAVGELIDWAAGKEGNEKTKARLRKELCELRRRAGRPEPEPGREGARRDRRDGVVRLPDARSSLRAARYRRNGMTLAQSEHAQRGSIEPTADT